MAEFFQIGPELHDPFRRDPALQAWLRLRLPQPVVEDIRPGLEALSARAAGEMLQLAAEAEAQPPEHVPYDPWGRRIDEIRTSEGWKALERIAAEEGVVATAYERRHGAWSRVHQFARLYLYHPSSAICSCPMAMTDGAARVLEVHGDSALRERVLARLTSRDPERFWTSGQWMTERAGGSDVSRSETVADCDGERFSLYGTKWFTSATTAQMSMTLARIREGDQTDEELSLFFVETRDPESGRLNDIEVHRLKDKLGTRALPTAELSLHGTPGIMVGERGRGVATIATILNITRLYNACCAAGYIRRGLDLALDYATKRWAFGRKLVDQPLHREALADVATEHHAALALVFEAAEWLGREETGEAEVAELDCLRVLTPVVKLYTAKQGVACASELVECFGGAGYVEDTGLPRLLRDAQVLSIWEGTTNVLSLDLLRAMGSDGRRWQSLMAHLESRLTTLPAQAPQGPCEATREALGALSRRPGELMEQGEESAQAGARDLAYLTARTVAAVLLLEQAANETDEIEAARARAVAERWCRYYLAPGLKPSRPQGEADAILARMQLNERD